MNPVERMKYLRFQLETLGTDNSHHVFEQVCYFLAKKHVAPNLVYPTGPVASKGDQARDFETFRCHLGGEDIVFACTTQQTAIDGKIRDDVETATTRGENVDAVYAMLSTDYPVGKRHELMAKVREEFNVRLEILDREWIADKLSEPSSFWIAKEFLGVAEEFAPPTSESTQRVSRMLAPDVDLADRLELLPVTAADALSDPEAVSYRPYVEVVVDAILRSDPKSIVQDWATNEPVWIRDAPGVLLFALGHLAQAFGLTKDAMRYFECAGAAGFDPARSYILAASSAQDVQPERVQEFIELTRDAGGSRLVNAGVAAMNGDWATVLEMTDDAAVLDEPLLVTPYLAALQGTGRIDAAISFLRRFQAKYPKHAGQAIQLSQLLSWRGSQPHNLNRQEDHREALSLAIHARDVRRSWRGDSTAAVRVACAAAILAGRHLDAIRLGTPEPAGDAYEFEADDPQVQFAVAQASIAIGNLEGANRLAAAASGFEKALIDGDILQASHAPQAELDAAFEAAWALVASEDDKVTFWLSAAGAGVDPLPGREELATRTDELPVLCEGMSLIARKSYDEAITLLRPLRQLEPARRLLTNAYLFQGRLDDAVAELLDMSQRFANVEHAIQAVRLLVGDGRLEEAAVHAATTLNAVALGRPERNSLHQVGVAAATQQQDWLAVERRAHAWVTESGGSPRLHWILVQAIFNQGDLDRAWHLVEQDESCPVERPLEAALWIALHHRFRPGTETLRAALNFARAFPDEPLVRRAATNAALLDGPAADGLTEDEVAHFHRLVEERTNTPDPDDTMFAIRVPDDDDADGLVEAFRPVLEEQAQRVAVILDRARKEGLPLGLVSVVAGRPYTKVLATRPLGYLPIASPYPTVIAQEMEVAAAALKTGHVIVDVSAIAVGWFQQKLWRTLVGSFVTVSVTLASKRDITASIDVGLAISTHSLEWDVRAGQPVLHETDPEAVARVMAHVAWISSEAGHMSIAETPPDANEVAWMATLEAAKARAVPVWADDAGLRRLARQEGVAAFGTDALMAALRDAGTLSDDAFNTGLLDLREEFCTDLPLAAEWVVTAAERDGWTGGPALLAMSRPSTWQNPQEAFAVWRQIFIAAANDDARVLPQWAHAAATGIAQAFQETLPILRLTAWILATAAFASDGDPTVFAACAAYVAAAADNAGVPDPTGLALDVLLQLTSQTAGPETAAVELQRLGAELAHSQAEALMRVLSAHAENGKV